VSPSPLLLDTSLLVLFVVGTAGRGYIAKHKRCRAFSVEDFDTLVRIIARAPSVLVTPNVLTEASNLVAQIGEPARAEMLLVLRSVIDLASETYVPSKSAAARREFVRLGLTDASLLETSASDRVVLTSDLGLYLAAQAMGQTAVNFNHIRDQYLSGNGGADA
jgi:hypothetical protein